MIDRRGPTALSALFSVILGAGHAMAAGEGTIEELLALDLEELLEVPVTTASRHRELRTDSPAHLIVITREQIRDRRYRDLADLLEDLPGVDFMRGTKSSAFNNFSIHGHESNNKLLILMDGVRIDHPAGGKVPVAENYPLYAAKQVEVLYGPASALYGADAFAGVINIITDGPLERSGITVTATVGENDQHRLEALAGLRINDKLSLSVGGHNHSDDRAYLPEQFPADFPRVDATTFGGAVALPAAARENYTGPVRSESRFARLDYGDHLTLGYNQSFFRSLTSTGDRPDTALYLEAGQWNTTLRSVYAQYRFELTPKLKGELTLDYADYEVDPRSKYVNIFTDFADHGYDYAYADRWGIEQQFTWEINEADTLVAGIGARDYHAIETPDLPRPYTEGLTGFQYLNTTLPIRAFESDYHNAALYGQWQRRWNDAFSTTIGLRYDRNSDYDDVLNPRLGLVYKHSPNSFFKLLYGEAFRAPSPEERFSTFGAFDGSTNATGDYIGAFFRAPNPDLQPERSKDLSLTWDWRPRPDLNLIANAFYGEVSELIVTADDPLPVQFIPGAQLLATERKQNIGEAHHYGLDLILQSRFALNEAWKGEMWGSYSYIDGAIAEDLSGREWDLSYIAEHKLKLGATLRYRGRYTITPKFYWIGDTNTGRKLDNNNPPERRQSPGYTLVNLHLGAEDVLAKGLSAHLDLYNLFDERYYAAGGSGSTTFVAMPQQPRTVMLSLQYRH